MYKQFLLAICFATATFFSVSQVSASHSNTGFGQYTDAQIAYFIQQLDDEELARGLEYLSSKGMVAAAMQSLQYLGDCRDCEYHAQAAANAVFQSVYTSTGDLNEAAGQSFIEYVRVNSACILVCDTPQFLGSD